MSQSYDDCLSTRIRLGQSTPKEDALAVTRGLRAQAHCSPCDRCYSNSMNSPKIAFRVSPELLAECHRLATDDGVPVGEWARRLVEAAAGVKASMKTGGFADLSKDRLLEVTSAGGHARAKAMKKRKSEK